MGKLRDIGLVLQKRTNPQNKYLVQKKYARKCVEQWMFG